MILTLLLFSAALLYSSVGHGGGSAYLSLFHIVGEDPHRAASNALLLNLAVSSVALLNFRKYFSPKHALPFVITSVPAAYIGGSLNVAGGTVRLITGILVFLAGVRMLVRFSPLGHVKGMGTVKRITLSGLSGAVLGMAAGVIGIGGGIFLSPVLMLLGYDSKETAAVSSFFIMVNSASGLVARSHSVPPDITGALAWIPAVLVGGFLGSALGAYTFKRSTVRALLGVVLLVAGAKLVL